MNHRPLTSDQRLTLGIETSGFGGSIALVREGVVMAQCDLDPTGRRHARSLVPEIGHLLTSASLTVSDLDLIAVSIGPGSFTGLRVGVVCAKTLAWAASADVVAVDTYLAIASQSPADVDRVDVVGDGQRGDLYVGRYQRVRSDEWIREGELTIRAADEWLAELESDTVVTGPGLERHAGTAAARGRVLPRELWSPRAASIALLGERRWRSGVRDDVWLLEPFYLRKSSAEEKADSPK